ncbi:MAG TPA: glycosyltransferase [Propionibacteriaceae bacterium]|nr:glycosyltransferase [Propionibacteriaceae bacterium]
MRVLIYTFGTQGDIQPYVALADALGRAGHEAVICTAGGFRGLVEAHGVDFVPMGDEMLELVQGAMPAMRGPRDVGSLIRRMTAAMRTSLEEQWAAAQQVEPTVIVYHPKALGGYHIAERLEVVGVASLPLPFFTPTRQFPIPFIGHWPFGGRANELSYQFNRFTAVAYGGMINTFRRRTLGLGPLRRWDDYLHRADGSPVPILYCFSQHVRPIPDDYPSQAHVTGYWFLDREDPWKPSEELTEFLDRGEAPVYVGFGSMGFAKDGDRRREDITTALARTGVRGVLATGWGGIPAGAADPNVITIDNVPHDWLFPRMAAVVHHGGAGTTAAGLRAGRPTLICPFLGDQPFWGHQIQQLGTGPKPLPQRQLNANRLTERIGALLDNHGYAERAAEIAQRLRSEDGASRAVEVLESIQRANRAMSH